MCTNSGSLRDSAQPRVTRENFTVKQNTKAAVVVTVAVTVVVVVVVVTSVCELIFLKSLA